jgi:isoleucyl-tRNA synthetase
MNDKGKSYKETLNLPQTDFDMRAGLLEKEPKIRAGWDAADLYAQVRAARSGAPKFILHDGPPYANGNIHIGHAMNKTLKDVVVRYKTMTGFDCPYVHGWDCHGLPIESKVQQDVGPELVRMSHAEVRRRCAEYAQHWVHVQTDQFKRLGVVGDWGNSYVTMSPQYEAGVLEVFAKMVEQGLVYKQLKPVHWSIENRTALAEAELEYEERTDDSIFVLLAAADDAAAKAVFGVADAAPMHLMIWTTTPWTLPANLAVAAHPDYEYAAVRFERAGASVIAILAESLAGKVLAAAGVTEFTVLGKVKGHALVEAALTYRHPLIEGKSCPVVQALYVTLEDGTGLVHTAPGHGLEDYGTGMKNGLEVYCPVLADGTFDNTAPAWLVGKSVWKANPLVVEFLEKAGTLFRKAKITHSYPHDWRSKTPTIFRATEQWFIAVDRQMNRGTTLRDMALDFCRREADDAGIDFVPAWGRNRLTGMLQSRPDWCISRQRAWGLPIPAFYNADGQPLLTPASVRAVARHFAQHGSDSWFNHTPAELLAGYDPKTDKDLTNPQAFAVAAIKQGYDIIDVWFESGSSWQAAAIAKGLVKEIPVDMYLEGSDQHRGWFQLSLLPALGAQGVPPFKTVLTHGWVMDEHGRKMSKSEGNTIDVIEQLAKRGADVLRLWVASQNYTDDANCSEALIAQAEDAYRKLRNTLRYCMGSCYDFNPAVNAAEPAAHSLDRWMRLELHRLIRDVRAGYDRYEFHRSMRMLYEFCTVQASSVYMAAVKDRLYCEAPNSPRRRATQTVLHEMLMALTKLLAPIMPHTAEEVWAHIPNRDPKEPASVHLALMPEVDEEMLAAAEAAASGYTDTMTFEIAPVTPTPAMIWQQLFDLRQDALLKLEAVRNAGLKNPMDAEAVFTIAEGNTAAEKFLTLYLGELEDLLGVGYARIEKAGATPAAEVAAEPAAAAGAQTAAEPAAGEKTAAAKPITVRIEDARAKYDKCARCWKRRPDVGSDSEYPDLSARDAAVVSGLAGK